MKKIKYLVFLTVLAFASCEDATDITQPGEVNDEATFTSTGQMQLYLSEAYDKIDQSSPTNGIAVSSLLTDEVGIGRGGSVTSNFYRFVVGRESGFSSAIWSDNYTVINYCNRIFRGAGFVVPVNAADQLVYNDVLAQARALRAYSYLQLLTYFSPNMKNDAELGVILLDRVPTLLEVLPRNTNGEIFALMESDLNFAYANIQPSTLLKPWTYVSKGMINAVRARMYAYRGNYPLAEQYATSAIADSGVGIVDGTASSSSYTPTGQFYTSPSNNLLKRMYQDASQGEMIWSIGRVPLKSAIATAYCVNATTTAGVTLFDMNRNLFNILDNGATSNATGNGTTNTINLALVNDIRRFVNIDPTLVVTGGVNGYLTSANYQFSDNLPIDKYSGITGAALINDIKAFRVSEMVFIQAEARVAAGNLAGAALLLKSIRDKRTIVGHPAPLLPVYANATAAWADILLERRLELCFEGHRYMDLKRLGALAGQTIDRHPLDCSTYSLPECSMTVTDYRFTLPIPLTEVSANPTIQQNPGYPQN